MYNNSSSQSVSSLTPRASAWLHNFRASCQDGDSEHPHALLFAS
jgi:hypothetical protein